MGDFLKEIFATLPITDRAEILLDTCFLYWLFTVQKEKDLMQLCEQNIVALSSFTIEEVLLHAHDVSHVFRERFRKLLKRGLRLYRIDVPVSPGNWEGEYMYVHSVAPELLQVISDKSDAVVAALAYALRAKLLTRDKHHLFTPEVQNLFQKRGISVQKELVL